MIRIVLILRVRLPSVLAILTRCPVIVLLVMRAGGGLILRYVVIAEHDDGRIVIPIPFHLKEVTRVAPWDPEEDLLRVLCEALDAYRAAIPYIRGAKRGVTRRSNGAGLWCIDRRSADPFATEWYLLW